MTVLFVPRSPPCSGVFLAVVQNAVGFPSHPFLKSFLFQPPKQIKSVVSLSTSQDSRLSGVRPSFLGLFLAGCVRLKISKFGRSFTFLGFDIPGILSGESYNRSLCAYGVIR